MWPRMSVNILLPLGALADIRSGIAADFGSTGDGYGYGRSRYARNQNSRTQARTASARSRNSSR